MATERCPQCGHGLRDGECTHPDCGYVPGPALRLVKPAVDRPHQPTHATTPRPSTTPAGPPTDQERQVGIPWVERCRQTLAEHQPPPLPVAVRLRQVARDVRLPESPSGGARGRRAGRDRRPVVNVSRSLPLVDDPHGLRLPCISCGGELPTPPWSITLFTDDDTPVPVADVAECPTCGVRYAGELLRRAHPEQWAYVMLNGLACRDCDHRAPMIWTDDDDHPIPCPSHGAHPAASQ